MSFGRKVPTLPHVPQYLLMSFQQIREMAMFCSRMTRPIALKPIITKDAKRVQNPALIKFWLLISMSLGPEQTKKQFCNHTFFV
jgi:hypothetical protein